MSSKLDTETENKSNDIPAVTKFSLSEGEEESRLPDGVSFADVAPAVEFACWVVVGLAPLLRWVNGAAVTDDQFVIQATLVASAAIGATGLRIYNWRAVQSHRE